VIVLGIDIGGSGIKGAPVDLTTGQLTADRYRIPTPTPATPEAVANTVAAIAQHFKWSGPIGCTLPARVQNGFAQTASNIDEAWIGTNANAVITKATGCPTIVLNDADAAGVAEMAFGAARDSGHDEQGVALMLTFGTGIGSALFVGGTLVPNTELGHIKFADDTAEEYASDRIRKAEDLSWEAWGERVQELLEHYEFLFGPDLIIIGGGVSKESKRGNYFSHLSTDARLVPAALENEAGIVGAAYHARTLTPASDDREDDADEFAESGPARKPKSKKSKSKKKRGKKSKKSKRGRSKKKGKKKRK
jgi:polyphosphate glucokinase